MTKSIGVWATVALTILCVRTSECVHAQLTPNPVSGTAPDAAVSAEQARLLDELDPTYVNRFPSGAVAALGGAKIETIDLAEVLLPSKSQPGDFEINEDALLVEIEGALERLRPLTLRNRRLDLAIEGASVGPTSSPGMLRVTVVELIDGIPVYPDGEFHIDAASGHVQYFKLPFIADGVKPEDRSLWLTEQQAVAVAQQAIVSEQGGTLPTVVEATLHLFSRGSELEVRPRWAVRFSAHYAVVDALTAETRIWGPGAIN